MVIVKNAEQQNQRHNDWIVMAFLVLKKELQTKFIIESWRQNYNGKNTF